MVTTLSKPLPTLATEINAEHDAAIGHARQAIDHAKRCGELLVEAKAQLHHGEWLPWLGAHCSISERQARNYMRVAENWNLLPHDEDLTIKGAIAHLAGPRGKSEPGADFMAGGTQPLRHQLTQLAIQEIRERAAMGSLLNWADEHHKKHPNKFGWLFDVTRDELDSLLAFLGPDNLEQLQAMAVRTAASYGLSATPWPHAWILAITREHGGKKARGAADQYAAELQQRLDAAGLGHDAMADRRAKADAWLADCAARAGCTLEQPNDEFFGLAFSEMLAG